MYYVCKYGFIGVYVYVYVYYTYACMYVWCVRVCSCMYTCIDAIYLYIGIYLHVYTQATRSLCTIINIPIIKENIMHNLTEVLEQ